MQPHKKRDNQFQVMTESKVTGVMMRLSTPDNTCNVSAKHGTAGGYYSIKVVV